jgi:hypothetical protein
MPKISSVTDPVPSVLLDRSAAENTLEIVVGFFTGDDAAALVKRDLIKAVHAALDTNPGKRAAHSGDLRTTGRVHRGTL